MEEEEADIKLVDEELAELEISEDENMAELDKWLES